MHVPSAQPNQQPQMGHGQQFQQQQQQRLYSSFPAQQQQFAQQQQQQQQFAQPPNNPESTKNTLEERIKHILPPPIQSEMLTDLESLSVPQLCQLGREVVQDISVRALNVLSFFKLGPNRRNNPALDLEAILKYSERLFEKLLEIRVLIERVQPEKQNKQLDEELFFDKITDPEPLPDKVDELASTRNALVEQFEVNRAKIIDLSNKIKKLEWYATTIDPRI